MLKNDCSDNEKPKCKCPICGCRKEAEPGLYVKDYILLHTSDGDDRPICRDCADGTHTPAMA